MTPEIPYLFIRSSKSGISFGISDREPSRQKSRRNETFTLPASRLPPRRRFRPLPSRRPPTARQRRTFTKGQYASGRRADRTREVEALCVATPNRVVAIESWRSSGDHHFRARSPFFLPPPPPPFERHVCTSCRVIRDVIPLLIASVKPLARHRGTTSSVNC